MGYRHYLGIIDKETFKKIDDDFIKQNADEDGYWGIYSIVEKCGKEIIELGKYSKEGSRLETKKQKISEDFLPAYNTLKKHCDNHEYGFNLLTKRDLEYLIRCYKIRTVRYWKRVLGLIEDKFDYDKKTPEEKCKQYVQEKLNWRTFLVNMKDPYKVQDCWLYEYELFNLVHCYKMIDWDKYCLIIYGW